jgi:hypothetical protein
MPRRGRTQLKKGYGEVLRPAEPGHGALRVLRAAAAAARRPRPTMLALASAQNVRWRYLVLRCVPGPVGLQRKAWSCSAFSSSVATTGRHDRLVPIGHLAVCRAFFGAGWGVVVPMFLRAGRHPARRRSRCGRSTTVRSPWPAIRHSWRCPLLIGPRGSTQNACWYFQVHSFRSTTAFSWQTSMISPRNVRSTSTLFPATTVMPPGRSRA